MLQVNVETANLRKKVVFSTEFPISGENLLEELGKTLGYKSCCFYLTYNGLLVKPNDLLQDGEVSLVPRIYGGKGGFGSMLRAIGAQIEKTTNREACRDLSGRRLRDINAEKRLKEWLEKNKDVKDDKTERLKRKIQKLLAQPKHEFKDKKYEEQRSNLTENVENAVEEGFRVAAGTSGIKRTHEENLIPQKRKKTILDEESDDSDDDNSSDSSSSNDEEQDSKDSASESHMGKVTENEVILAENSHTLKLETCT